MTNLHTYLDASVKPFGGALPQELLGRSSSGLILFLFCSIIIMVVNRISALKGETKEVSL